MMRSYLKGFFYPFVCVHMHTCFEEGPSESRFIIQEICNIFWLLRFIVRLYYNKIFLALVLLYNRLTKVSIAFYAYGGFT